MGACYTKKKPEHLHKQIYSINKFGSEIIAFKKVEQPLKFDIRLHNFKAKGLDACGTYWVKIEIGLKNPIVYEILAATGAEPKFFFDESITIQIKFEELESTFLNIYFYSETCKNKPRISTKEAKHNSSAIYENQIRTKQFKSPSSIMSIDFLTLIVGPEHNDIHLLDAHNTNKILGRLSFDILCQQVGYASLNINSIECKLNHCFNNEIAFKLNCLHNHSIFESEYTGSVKGEINSKKDITTYKLDDSQSSESLKNLSLKNILISLHDLRSFNLEIKLYEVTYELKDNKEQKETIGEELNNDKENLDLIKNNEMILTPSVNPNTKIRTLRTSIHFTNPENDENNITSVDFDKLDLENAFLNRQKTKKIIFRENILEKFDNHNEKILVKHEIDQKSTMEVIPHYNDIGYSRINFYNVLAQQDNLIFNQSSLVFQKFSYLYQNVMNEDISKFKRNRLNSTNEQHEPTNTIHNNRERLKSVVVNKNANIYSSARPILSECSEDNKEKDLESNLNAKSNYFKFHVYSDVVKTKFKSEIFFNGKPIGEIKGTISVKNIPMIRQMMCGVHTERGLDISANLLFTGARLSSSHLKTEDTLPVEVKELSDLSSNLISKIISTTTLTQLTFSYRELSIQIIGILNNIVKILLKTHNKKESQILMFDYKSVDDLLRSQQIMLELSLNLINMLETLSNEARTLCFKIIETVLEREEFALYSMTLVAGSDNINDNLFLQSRIKVLEDYFDFIIKTLDFTLSKLSSKVTDAKTKNFIENFLAVAYLRVPKFQEAFLDSVKKNVYDVKNEPISEENRYSSSKGAEQIAQESSRNLHNFNSIVSVSTFNRNNTQEFNSSTNLQFTATNFVLLDWQFLFYDKMDKLPGVNFNDKYAELEEILYKKTEWKERISKRGLGFYYVVSRIEKYILKKVGKDKSINWNEIPGFKIIIDSIIYELQTRDVHTYPQPLVDILKIFICDYGIMNKFYKTIIEKTNAYNTLSVFNSIKILDYFFEEYEKKKEISDFSSKFDYNLIKKAAHAILTVDNSLCVAKLIWLYYKNTHLMNIIHVQEIFAECFKTKFFNLFFHWSWQVRDTFYNFIWFTINHRLKNKNFSNDKNKICKERLEYLTNKDEGGFFKAFSTEYPEDLKKVILGDYYEKMRVIEIIRSIVRKEKLDPTFNTHFFTMDPKVVSKVNSDLQKYVVV